MRVATQLMLTIGATDRNMALIAAMARHALTGAMAFSMDFRVTKDTRFMRVTFSTEGEPQSEPGAVMQQWIANAAEEVYPGAPFHTIRVDDLTAGAEAGNPLVLTHAASCKECAHVN